MRAPCCHNNLSPPPPASISHNQLLKSNHSRWADLHHSPPSSSTWNKRIVWKSIGKEKELNRKGNRITVNQRTKRRQTRRRTQWWNYIHGVEVHIYKHRRAFMMKFKVLSFLRTLFEVDNRVGEWVRNCTHRMYSTTSYLYTICSEFLIQEPEFLISRGLKR